jgi:hypothetical protein
MPAVSKAQQRFMGMVHAADKGETPASPEVAKVSADMKDSDAKDFASTKHDGLPDHVKEQLKSLVREVIREKNGMNEMSGNDVHFKHIMKMYDRGGSFTKKKIGAVVCKDPKASRKDIEEVLFDSDYKDITEFEDELGLDEIREKYSSVNEEFKHVIHVDTPTQVVSKPVAAQIMALAKKGVRSKDIGLEMGFVGNAKLAADTFQKVKNKIYFELDKRNESVNEAFSDKKVDAKIIADRMRKNSSTKSFADKVEKLGKVSAEDLDKMLPDFVAGSIIASLFKESVNEGAHGMATKLLQSIVSGDSSRAEGTKMSKELAQHYIDWIRTSPFGKKNGNLPLDMLVKASFNWGIERGLDSKLKGELSKLKSTIKESVNEAKYPTNLYVGSIIYGQGFTGLKGIEGGKYYKVVEMDDTTATLAPCDQKGKITGSKKVRHKLDSIEGGIKTAKRGDENGIVVESVNEEHDCGCNENHDCGCGGLHEHHINEDISADANGIAGLTASRASAVKDFLEKNNINSNKLYLFLKKGNLKDRMDFVTALVGKPGNPIQKKVISQFSN